MKLYELSAEIAAVERQLENCEDEKLLELKLQLEAAKGDKLENILKLRKNFAALSEAREAESKRLKALADSDLKRVEALDEYVRQNLKVGEKFRCSIGEYGWIRSEVCVPTENNLDKSAPKEFFRMEPKLLLADIKAAIKGGQKIVGWLIKEKQNLQVK